MNPGNVELALDAMAADLKNDYQCHNDSRKGISDGGISAIDVLVCTPGRLVDHLDNTPGFTLQHLRFLVIDECDRLLSQSYHGWIQRVLDSVHAPTTICDPECDKSWKDIDPVSYRRSVHDASRIMSASADSSLICQRVQLRKLLYSATLTKDPQKLASLQLVNPKHFNAHHLMKRQAGDQRDKSNPEGSLYRMPEQLQEYTVECTAEQKPLVLLALLLERLQRPATASRGADGGEETKNVIVVFTSSLESTHRLTRLLQLLWQAADYGQPPLEFSSSLSQSQRSQLMQRCNDPSDHSVSVLVCSDGMSRGMDLSSVRTVIHYDVPGMAKTYVHRCGRTARAGKDGHAIALLKGKGQVGQFSRLRRLIAHPERVAKAPVKTSLVRRAIPLYKGCVSCLKEVLVAEERHELKPIDSDLTKWLPLRHKPNDDLKGTDDEPSSSSSSSSETSATMSSRN